MQAIVHDTFGPPEVLELETQPEPTLAGGQVLVAVHATSVTTADWRFRAAKFPVGMRFIGRLIVGFLRPRQRLTGREFSGRVVAVGRDVRRFAVGDEVFGVNPGGVNAELIAVPETAAVLHKPPSLSHAEAAALPFGAMTAVAFVRDLAKVQAGERVLVVGASGGVGAYTVQVAKHLGAEVTGVASTENLGFLRELGVDHVVDYTTQDPAQLRGSYDVIIDTIGKTTFRGYRALLGAHGRHAFVEGGVREILQSLFAPRRGPKVVFTIASDTREALEEVCALVQAGAIRAVVGHRFPMTEVVAAHRVVGGRKGRRGAVILEWPAGRREPALQCA